MSMTDIRTSASDLRDLSELIAAADNADRKSDDIGHCLRIASYRVGAGRDRWLAAARDALPALEAAVEHLRGLLFDEKQP